MDLLTFLMQSPPLAEKCTAQDFAANWAVQHFLKGAQIVGQDDQSNTEFIILDGCLISQISDADGTEVCVSMSDGASILTPHIARTRNGRSLVSIEAATNVTVAHIDTKVLTDLMIASKPVRNWANDALREELARKADREWCLTALGGADRLTWFRDRYPDYEDIFTHAIIASFLGMTPVTLSRLRRDSDQK